MRSLAGAAGLLLLPGILILRGPLWLALPASLAFWLVGWSLCALGFTRSALLHGGLAFACGLALVGLPRLTRARYLLAGSVTLLLALPLVVDLGLPWSQGVAREAASARLLAWHDGVPRVQAPLGQGAFRWPGGIAPLAADVLLLARVGVPAALWIVVLMVGAAFVLVASAPRGGRPRPAHVAASVAAAGALGLFEPGWLLALTLMVAAGRLLREKGGPPAAFGAAVLGAGALVVAPLVAVPAALAIAARERRRAAGALGAAVLLVVPLGLPSAPAWPTGHLEGPSAPERAALARLEREAPPLARVCATPRLEPWVPALAARRTAAPSDCSPGLTSFHTVPPNPRPANP